MKKTGLIVLALICFAALAAAQTPTYQPAQREIKKYFPGDYVHVMVDAPQDTAKITAIMPNGDIIELVHDRRLGIWTGLWQVPISFKAGSYAADLQASDIEGNKYSGHTSPFIVGELTMVTMIQKQVTPETPAQQGERMARETALLAIQPEAPAQPEVAPQPTAPAPTTTTTTTQPQAPKPAPKPVAPKPAPQPKAPPVVTPKTLPPEVAPVIVVKQQPAAPAVKKKVVKAVVRPKKQLKFVAVDNSRELNLTKAKLVTTARYYMEKMDFAQVQGQLNTLVKIDPKNKEYKKMLQRVNKVIEAEKRRNP